MSTSSQQSGEYWAKGLILVNVKPDAVDEAGQLASLRFYFLYCGFEFSAWVCRDFATRDISKANIHAMSKARRVYDSFENMIEGELWPRLKQRFWEYAESGHIPEGLGTMELPVIERRDRKK